MAASQSLLTLWQFFTIWSFLSLSIFTHGLREFRLYSTRSQCLMAEDINYPFAYSKYSNQTVESKVKDLLLILDT
eukprot:scaffold1035_cov192-Ochromonas_danica.AAC.8